jgi:ABC-type nitrate/sulfonate/bicarbonate transport system substrate-binding protein
VLLALIGLMPFTTALLGRYDEPLAVNAYALNVGLTALADGLTAQVALQDGLFDDHGGDELEAGRPMVGAMARAAVFFVSIPIAYGISPSVAMWSWLLLIPLGVALGRWGR